MKESIKWSTDPCPYIGLISRILLCIIKLLYSVLVCYMYWEFPSLRWNVYAGTHSTDTTLINRSDKCVHITYLSPKPSTPTGSRQWCVCRCRLVFIRADSAVPTVLVAPSHASGRERHVYHTETLPSGSSSLHTLPNVFAGYQS